MAENEQPEFLRESPKLRDIPLKPEQPAPAPSKDAPANALQPPNLWVEERTRIAVGHGINVSGKLIFSEPVRIEGKFKGEVTSSSLVVIAEDAKVEGRVRAARLVVMGELRGDIVDASRAYVGPHGRVHGDVATEKLTICEGGYLSGNVRMAGMHPDPIVVA